MTPPLEHDYIGLSKEVSSTLMEASEKLSSNGESELRLLGSLKGTELRLGLPGSESPEREDKAVLTLGPPKGSSGAKRAFSDAITGGGKWVFSSGIGGPEGELGKNCGLFSSKGETGNMQLTGNASGCKEAGLNGKAPVVEKNDHTLSQVVTALWLLQQKVVVAWLQPLAFRRRKWLCGVFFSNFWAQVVGWPPIRNYRKNTMATNPLKNNDDSNEKQGLDCLYVKVSMDGAPYLRKVDLKMYCNYKELSSALEKMFSCFTIGQCGSHGLSGKDGSNDSRLTDMLRGSEYVLTYEDRDGDWMLVGDVPWVMFTETCKRLRIMKGSEAIGLAPRVMEKCKSRK